MKVARAFPVFSAVFVLIYALGITLNNTFLFFYPKIGLWHWGRIPKGTGDIGIASQWYGWTSTALVTALVVAAIYLAIPALARVRTWSGWSWLIPLAMWLVAINVIVHLYWLPKPG